MTIELRQQQYDNPRSTSSLRVKRKRNLWTGFFSLIASSSNSNGATAPLFKLALVLRTRPRNAHFSRGAAAITRQGTSTYTHAHTLNNGIKRGSDWHATPLSRRVIRDISACCVPFTKANVQFESVHSTTHSPSTYLPSELRAWIIRFDINRSKSEIIYRFFPFSFLLVSYVKLYCWLTR